jgi:hypothetical protein
VNIANVYITLLLVHTISESGAFSFVHFQFTFSKFIIASSFLPMMASTFKQEAQKSGSTHEERS